MKLPGGGCGEHLGNRLFVLRRDLPVIKEEIAAHVLSITLTNLLRPLMVLAGVIHHEVYAQVDALFVAGISVVAAIARAHRAGAWNVEHPG